MSVVEMNLDRLEPGRSALDLADKVLVREEQLLQGHRVPGFQARVSGNLDVDSMDQKVVVHGQFAATREMLCDRSGEPFEMEYPVQVEIIVLRRPGRGSDAELGQELGEDDNWVIHQPGGVVDLTDALLEAVVLDRPQHVYHPDHRDQVAFLAADEAGGKVTDDDEAIDPRWAALKELRDRRGEDNS